MCIKYWIKRCVHDRDIAGGGGEDCNERDSGVEIVVEPGPHQPELCQMCQYLRKPCFKKRRR